MVSAQAVIRKNKKTMQILTMTKGTHYNGVQLFGCEPNIMSDAAMIVESLGYDYIDINMGCTIKKITNKGAGVTLMKKEELASTITSSVVRSVNIPVTCKIRIGVTKQDMNALSLSQQLMDAGATAITIHGRTGEKKFGLPIDFESIKAVVNHVPIPIVANGGIFSGNDAYYMLQQTGAAAVMPGRGLIGNPWIIPEICSIFSQTDFISPNLKQKKETCIEHMRNLCDFYGEHRGVLKMRTILPYYFSTCHQLRNLKLDVQHMSNCHEILDLVSNIYEADGHIVYDTTTLLPHTTSDR
jgi:tRNA-dihydrouridine synthase B